MKGSLEGTKATAIMAVPQNVGGIPEIIVGLDDEHGDVLLKRFFEAKHMTSQIERIQREAGGFRVIFLPGIDEHQLIALANDLTAHPESGPAQ